MTKKYRLIREYPGSPKLGTIAEKAGDVKYTYPNGAIRYEASSAKSLFDTIISCNPEYWEEVVEKNYEIISWYFGDMNITKNPDGSAREYFIHSVKRLSDGEIFTIGDKLRGESNTIVSLDMITLYQDKILLQANHTTWKLSINLDKGEKIKKPVFTTEDGIDIYENSKNPNETVKLYLITKGSFTIQLYHKSIKAGFGKNVLYFSTKEAAEEYVLMNKPCLSLNDVGKIYKTANISMNEYNSKKSKNQDQDQGVKIIDLIKEKLKN